MLIFYALSIIFAAIGGLLIPYSMDSSPRSFAMVIGIWFIVTSFHSMAKAIESKRKMEE